jgi:hypothetical protein
MVDKDGMAKLGTQLDENALQNQFLEWRDNRRSRIRFTIGPNYEGL